jgi:hypothetical protein
MTPEGYGEAKMEAKESTHDERIFNLEATVAIMRREMHRLQGKLANLQRHVGGVDSEPEAEEPYPLLGPGAHGDKILPGPRPGRP